MSDEIDNTNAPARDEMVKLFLDKLRQQRQADNFGRLAFSDEHPLLDRGPEPAAKTPVVSPVLDDGTINRFKVDALGKIHQMPPINVEDYNPNAYVKDVIANAALKQRLAQDPSSSVAIAEKIKLLNNPQKLVGNLLKPTEKRAEKRSIHDEETQ